MLSRSLLSRLISSFNSAVIATCVRRDFGKSETAADRGGSRRDRLADFLTKSGAAAPTFAPQTSWRVQIQRMLDASSSPSANTTGQDILRADPVGRNPRQWRGSPQKALDSEGAVLVLYVLSSPLFL